MGKVTYSPGIEYVKGSLAKPKKVDGHNHGDYLIGTHRKAPSQSDCCTRLYIRKGNVYDRTGELSDNEILARGRFGAVRAAVYTRAHNLTTIASDTAAFKAQKDLANGKKTFNAYLWKVCGQEYDAQHPRS